MKSCNYLIVEIKDSYNNEVNGIIINESIESVENINRIAKVVSIPDNIIIKEGSYVMIHHNIARMKNDIKGKQVRSAFWIKDDLYFVPPSEVFMYSLDGVNWNTLSPFVFIKPIDAGKLTGFELKDEVYKDKLHHKGIVAYNNTDSKFNVGDKIIFSKYSQYEFIINGEVYYKMKNKDILGSF